MCCGNVLLIVAYSSCIESKVRLELMFLEKLQEIGINSNLAEILLHT